MRILVLAVLFTASVSAHGYRVYGAGLDNCGTWTEQRKTPSNWHNSVSWIFGWVTASGFSSEQDGKTLPNPGTKTMIKWIDEYCGRHPEAKLETAAFTLVRALANRAE